MYKKFYFTFSFIVLFLSILIKIQAHKIPDNDAYIKRSVWTNNETKLVFESDKQQLIEENRMLKEIILEDRLSCKHLTNDLKNTLNKVSNLRAQTTHDEIEAPTLPLTCAEALQNGATSGVYRLQMPSSETDYTAYCLTDPNNGPAWTIIQRRLDGSVDFFRNWREYVAGFGNVSGEYWLGLEKLHALTNWQSHELWIELRDYNNVRGFGKYKRFSVADKNSNYVLKFLGEYSGDINDDFRHHVGKGFSTYDRNNDDNQDKNCAGKYSAGWWFQDCFNCNLNGLYYQENPTPFPGIAWGSWRETTEWIKYAQMAIRPIA